MAGESGVSHVVEECGYESPGVPWFGKDFLW